MTQEKFTAVESILSSLGTNDIVRIWNDYCDDCSYDSRVEYMDDFDNLWHDSDALWLIQRAFYGKFNPNDDYYVLNGYGNFVSFSYWDDNDSPIDMSELVDWVVENYNERDEYISEDDIADAFVEYINKNKPGEGNDLTLDEIYELADNGETYDLDTILNDDWDMWLANVSDALGNQEEE